MSTENDDKSGPSDGLDDKSVVEVVRKASKS
jgi:hypothetical protein